MNGTSNISMKRIRKRLCFAGVNEYDHSIQFWCSDVELFLNSHGNWQAPSDVLSAYYESRFKSVYLFNAYDIQSAIVFNREFECISHVAPRKALCKNVICVEPFISKFEIS